MDFDETSMVYSDYQSPNMRKGSTFGTMLKEISQGSPCFPNKLKRARAEMNASDVLFSRIDRLSCLGDFAEGGFADFPEDLEYFGHNGCVNSLCWK